MCKHDLLCSNIGLTRQDPVALAQLNSPRRVCDIDWHIRDVPGREEGQDAQRHSTVCTESHHVTWRVSLTRQTVPACGYSTCGTNTSIVRLDSSRGTVAERALLTPMTHTQKATVTRAIVEVKKAAQPLRSDDDPDERTEIMSQVKRTTTTTTTTIVSSSSRQRCVCGAAHGPSGKPNNKPVGVTAKQCSQHVGPHLPSIRGCEPYQLSSSPFMFMFCSVARLRRTLAFAAILLPSFAYSLEETLCPSSFSRRHIVRWLTYPTPHSHLIRHLLRTARDSARRAVRFRLHCLEQFHLLQHLCRQRCTFIGASCLPLILLTPPTGAQCVRTGESLSQRVRHETHQQVN